MANQWFRMYAEFATDPKVQMLSEVNQRRLTMLFCLRCNGNETLHETEIVFQLRVTHEEWLQTKAIFIDKGFIDSNNKILNWDKRQYLSDSSTERVARHRAKNKNNVTSCNVTVTPPDTEQNRTDKNITPLAMLMDMGVEKQIANDWIKVRKAKRLAITKTALDKIAIEATKANLTFAQAIHVACENGWGGFSASWMDKADTKKPDFMKGML